MPVQKFKFIPLFIIIAIQPYRVCAQTPLTINNISKIIFIDEGGGMEGSSSHTYEVSKQKGVWISEITGITSYNRMLEGTNGNYSHTGLHIFVKNIDEAAIKHLLLNIQRTTRFGLFNTGITPIYLREKLDSLDRPDASEDYANLTGAQKEFFKQKITVTTINEVVSEEMEAVPMDVQMGCKIKIVKNNNDTVRIETMGENAFMLPLKINNHTKSWDANISLFFASIMSDTVTYSNRKLLQGNDICLGIYRAIYEKYCQALFNRQYIEHRFPQTFNALRAAYQIVDISERDEREDPDPMVYVSVKTAAMPVNIFIGTTLHPKSVDSAQKLIAYKNKALSALKKDNFIFRYVAAHPGTCELNFTCPGAIDYFTSDSTNCEVLRPFKNGELVAFSFNNKNNRESSSWYLLPNGQLLLTSYLGKSVFGTPATKFRPQNMVISAGVCAVFDANGAMLKEY